MVEHDGATWFRHSDLEKDAVLIRSADVIPNPEDRPTYLASDIPYLWNKLVERKFDRAIYVGCRPPWRCSARKLLPRPWALMSIGWCSSSTRW